MKASTDNVAMKDGIERFEKVKGARASQQMMRYNPGALRYETECAFGLLERTAKAMSDANTDELRELVTASNAATAVLNAYFVLGDAVWAWLPAAANEAINVPFETKLLQAMDDFDDAVAALKQYL